MGLFRVSEDFAFRLTRDEWAAVMPQVADLWAVSNLRSQTATSRSHAGRRYLSVAFTEQGAPMAANILNSPPNRKRIVGGPVPRGKGGVGSAESARLEPAIKSNLRRLGYGG